MEKFIEVIALYRTKDNCLVSCKKMINIDNIIEFSSADSYLLKKKYDVVEYNARSIINCVFQDYCVLETYEQLKNMILHLSAIS